MTGGQFVRVLPGVAKNEICSWDVQKLDERLHVLLIDGPQKRDMRWQRVAFTKVDVSRSIAKDEGVVVSKGRDAGLGRVSGRSVVV